MAAGESNDELLEVTQLFDEYLEARGRGDDVDSTELLVRAGGHVEELRRRIDLYERLHDLADTPEDEVDELPARLDRFRLLASLGRGGLGQVYLALDPELGRQVALKVLEAGLTLDRRERDWVLNEARSLARLEHPGVVRVLEVGEANGRDYVVMEHLTGPTLSAVIRELRRSRKEVEEAGDQTPENRTEARKLAERLSSFSARIECLGRVARALAYCHDNGVLHRDIKPANIVFGKDDEPRLIDFGLAHMEDADEETKLDITQSLVGSPAYVSPEQVESERTGADPKSDQFSFAVVCYELLTLESPFKRESRGTTLDAIARAAPRRPRRIDPSPPTSTRSSSTVRSPSPIRRCVTRRGCGTAATDARCCWPASASCCSWPRSGSSGSWELPRSAPRSLRCSTGRRRRSSTRRRASRRGSTRSSGSGTRRDASTREPCGGGRWVGSPTPGRRAARSSRSGSARSSKPR